ncbi:MAG: cell division protein CrgA [Actinomycetota bacterium]
MPQSKSKRSRYTPPPPKKAPPSPLWVPVVMTTLMVVGGVLVVLNYMELLPGDAVNRYLLLGLAEITAGFMLATTYR